MRRWPVILAGALLLSCSEGAGPLTIIPGDLFSPSELDFGDRTVGQTHELTAILSNPQSADLRISDVRFEPPVDVFAARLEGGGTLRGALVPSGRRMGVRVLYAPRETRRYDTTMLVIFGDEGGALELKASGRRLVEGELAFSPPSLRFAPIEIGRTAKQSVGIENVGDIDVRLRDVRIGSTLRPAEAGVSPVFLTETDSETPLSELTIMARTSLRADVHFRPDRVGPFEDTLRFVLSNGNSSEFPITAEGAAPGNLSCAPGSVDFGLVRRGQSAEQDIVCTSSGGVSTLVRIELDATSASRFSIVTAPPVGTVLAPGASATVRVRFEAEGLALTHAGGLSLEAAHGEVIGVALSGRVEPPPPEDTALTATLRWDVLDVDVDLHLVRAGAPAFGLIDDCHFRSKNPDWGRAGSSLDDPFLDRDDVSTGGPEEINLSDAAEARYDVYVHYFRTPSPMPTEATLQLRLFGQVAFEGARMLVRCGDLWHVATVTFGGATPVITPVDAVTDAVIRAECR